MTVQQQPAMNHDTFNLIALGLIAVLTAVTVLLAMVHLEFGPKLQLAPRRRWLLAAALGAGVMAFTAKLLIITTIDRFPQFTIDPLKAHASRDRQPLPAAPVAGPPRYVWTALPSEPGKTAHSSVASHSPYVWQALPRRAPEPPDNPTTPEKVALGKQLFHDPLLSRDGTISCATCHDVYGHAGTDGLAIARGIDGQDGKRNAPTVWNTAFQALLFWDGRAESLEDQAMGPLLDPREMGMPSPAVVAERVRGQLRYSMAFARAFGSGTPIDIDHVVKAIAAYERSLITADTPYDRFVNGELDALTPAQVRGMALFQSLGCIACHHGPNFSAASVFDSRMPRRLFPASPTPYEQQYDLGPDGGAGADGTARGIWRVPSLRNVALTGPWLHNGSVTELAEVVRIMAGAQLGRSGHHLLWSSQQHTLQEMDMPAPGEQAVADIVAFLHALSSDTLVEQQTQRERYELSRDPFPGCRYKR